MYKKGTGEAVMGFAFFAIVVIIVAGTLWSANSFYKEYDFRKVEANLLRDRVLSCMQENDFFSAGFDFFSACRVNKESFESHAVYLKKQEKEFIIGVNDFITQCALSDKNPEYPKCVNGTYGDIEYLIGSNQKARRVLA